MSRILMVSLLYAGHTNPTLALAQELAERDHHVGYIDAPQWQERIREIGAAFIPYTDSPVNLSPSKRKNIARQTGR